MQETVDEGMKVQRESRIKQDETEQVNVEVTTQAAENENTRQDIKALLA